MPATPSTPLPARRVGSALGLLLAVLLLHAALLGLWQPAVGGAAETARRPLQVRQLVTRALLPAASPGPAQGAEAAPDAAPAVAAPPPPSPRPPRARAAPQAPAAAPVQAAPDTAETAPAPGSDGEALAGAPAEAEPTALAAGTPLPTYATRLPPPATLQYTVQRGGSLAGPAVRPAREGLQAQLIWRPDLAAASYTLSLGLGAVGSASVGGLDLHGIAPERHVETRRGREVRAANFQRQTGPGAEGAGRITFSGPRIEHPLLPGVQDRLSWMLQLAAVLAADPALGQPGRELTLLVVGVRGDAAPWVFRVIGMQTLQLPAGEVANALHLQREAQRPYDTRVDVWLDPARHHLPVRLRLQNRADGPGTDFELLRLDF